MSDQSDKDQTSETRSNASDAQTHETEQSQWRVTHKGYEITQDKDGKAHYKQLARQVSHKNGKGHRIHLDAIPFSKALDFFPVEKRLDNVRNPSAKNARDRQEQDHERE